MKFSLLYEELKFSDVFSKASPEEASERKKQYNEILLKNALEQANLVKLPDGTWHVQGDLNISNCGLTSLKDLNVSIVDRDFSCFGNELTNLEGCPTKIGRDFSCSNNVLTSLVGCPSTIGRRFFCSYNNLTSLVGGPTNIGSIYECNNNQLTTLEGSPEKIDGTFNCTDNMLKALNGAPKEVKNNFYCNCNKLTTLEGAPKKVGGTFSCYRNGRNFTSDDIKRVCYVGGYVRV